MEYLENSNITLSHTPMIKQYLEIKAEYPNYLLFYRMGDFYELFFSDAIRAAKLLDLTLTHRGKNLGNPIEMAGVPYHTVENYINRLIKLGETVVICEQLGEPNGKIPMERKVTRVISPGTITEEELLPHKHANLIVAILPYNNYFGLATLDLSTSWFTISNIDNGLDLTGELERLQPIEIILPQNLSDHKFINLSVAINYLEQIYFTPQQAKENLNKHFGTNFYANFIKKYQLNKTWHDLAAVCAAGALLYYVKSMYKHDLIHLKSLTMEVLTDSIIIDQQTRRNLEITTNIQLYQNNNHKIHTLLGILDHCKTSMGSRLLSQWLNRPIKDQTILNQRYNAISTFQESNRFEQSSNILSNISDLERIIARIGTCSAKPKDLIQLKQTFEHLPNLINFVANLTCKNELLQNIENNLSLFPELHALINRAITANPPIIIKEGNFIAAGYDEALDNLRSIYNDSDLYLNKIENLEKQKTKLSTLKIGFNKIQGYYIEISRNQSKSLPDYYIRRQTLKNVERFIVPELKDLEDKILSSKAKAISREKFLFMQILEELQRAILALQKTAQAIAELDVLTNLAERAIIFNWSKPTLVGTTVLNIVGGRHPVIETMSHINFIPNNLDLNLQQKMYIITGPNMGGKSTYMRQNALIVLLAHVGSFVPAYNATIGPIDRIFSRIGASDDLMQGKSTFMLEMLETANILKHATCNSLVIIDEIGRGTSTFDGISLAYGIATHLISINKCFCLFATHFLELAKLAIENSQIINVHLDATEDQGILAFLYTVNPGQAAKSFGLQVARLAGLPEPAIEIATKKLHELEQL